MFLALNHHNRRNDKIRSDKIAAMKFGAASRAFLLVTKILPRV